MSNFAVKTNRQTNWDGVPQTAAVFRSRGTSKGANTHSQASPGLRERPRGSLLQKTAAVTHRQTLPWHFRGNLPRPTVAIETTNKSRCRSPFAAKFEIQDSSTSQAHRLNGTHGDIALHAGLLQALKTMTLNVTVIFYEGDQTRKQATRDSERRARWRIHARQINAARNEAPHG